ncbi:MAG TPA: hypothetical protein VIK95_14045 [Egibacteraceae bacterium]
MDRLEEFVCPFCGPAPRHPDDAFRCGVCGRASSDEAVRAASAAWRRGSAALVIDRARPRDDVDAALEVALPRSRAAAVVLTLLWLGAGHLYVRRHAAGAGLVVAHLALLVLLADGATAVAVTLWALLALPAAVSSARIAPTVPGRVYRC